jgi:hypothetical protein
MDLHTTELATGLLTALKDEISKIYRNDDNLFILNPGKIIVVSYMDRIGLDGSFVSWSKYKQHKKSIEEKEKKRKNDEDCQRKKMRVQVINPIRMSEREKRLREKHIRQCKEIEDLNKIYYSNRYLVLQDELNEINMTASTTYTMATLPGLVRSIHKVLPKRLEKVSRMNNFDKIINEHLSLCENKISNAPIDVKVLIDDKYVNSVDSETQTSLIDSGNGESKQCQSDWVGESKCDYTIGGIRGLTPSMSVPKTILEIWLSQECQLYKNECDLLKEINTKLEKYNDKLINVLKMNNYQIPVIN